MNYCLGLYTIGVHAVVVVVVVEEGGEVPR